VTREYWVQAGHFSKSARSGAPPSGFVPASQSFSASDRAHPPLGLSNLSCVACAILSRKAMDPGGGARPAPDAIILNQRRWGAPLLAFFARGGCRHCLTRWLRRTISAYSFPDSGRSTVTSSPFRAHVPSLAACRSWSRRAMGVPPASGRTRSGGRRRWANRLCRWRSSADSTLRS